MSWKRVFYIVAGLALVAIVAGTGLTATYDDFVTGNRWVSQPAHEPANDKQVWIQSRRIDLGAFGFNDQSGVTQDDVVQCLTVPAGGIVTEIGFYAITSPVASAVLFNATLGDGADPNGYCTELDFVATGTTVWYTRGNSTVLAASKSGAYNNTSGISVYTGSDTIDLVIACDEANSTSGATPVFYIWAKGFQAPTQ